MAWAPPSLAWAIRLGLVLLVASQAVGGTIISNGLAHVQASGDIAGANLFGGVGAMKVPHAVTLHGAQVLPGLACVLGATGWSERRRLRLVLLAGGGYTALVAVTLLQAYRARATLALDLGTAVLAALGAAALAGAAAAALAGLVTTRRRGAIA